MRGQGRRAVFLHPVGLSGRFWDDVVERLAGTMECMALDLRGHGESTWDGQSFTLDDLANDVVEVLNDEAARPVILVGCSMGGMVAQGVALAAPHLVAGLVISNSAPALPQAARDGLMKRAQMARDNPQMHADDCVRRWFSEGFAAAQPERVEAIQNRLLATNRNAIAQSWLAVAGLDYGSRLAAFGGPVHVVTGEADSSSPPGAVASHAALFRRGSFEVVSQTGHLTPYEKPDIFSNIVLQLGAKVDQVIE